MSELVFPAPRQSTWAERIAAAVKHEKFTCQVIQMCGWRCEPFGQALLTEEMRAELRKRKTPLRWLPDLLASKDDVVVLIDAKSELRTDTPNFSIETAALKAHIVMEELFDLPIVYVWQNFTINRPEKVWADSVEMDSRWALGSRTPFRLTPKANQDSFVEFFGVPE